MTRPEASGASAAQAARHADLLAHLAAHGYAPVSPPVLQPVEPFLELSGEDIRRRIFVTQDEAGAELCLRPEFTIPVCRHHLATRPGAAADYAYLGPVFRLAAGEPDEFAQAGIESIGRTDTPAADAEVLALALEGLERLGRADAPDRVRVRLGDMGLTHAWLDALRVPPVAKRRTLRAIAAGRSLDEVTGAREADPHAGLLATIQGQDPHAARAFVEDVLAIAGISRVGGREPGEIAERFLAKAAAQADGGAGLNAENRALIGRYCAIQGDPDRALAALRALAREAGLDDPGLEAALSLFDERTGFMAARGLPIERFAFSGGFARNLDYYTGFIFEVTAASGAPPAGGVPPEGVLVGGGRYDGLLQHLGSPVALPAVGCAFWLARCCAGADGGAR